MENPIFWFIRRQKRKVAQQAEDNMAEGYDDLPDEKERRWMSPTRLAKLLSECEKGTSKYILVEHELNIRIAKVQSRATYVGVVAGALGIFVGAFLTAALQSQQSVQCVCKSNHACEDQRRTTKPVPPEAPIGEPSSVKNDRQPKKTSQSNGTAKP